MNEDRLDLAELGRNFMEMGQGIVTSETDKERKMFKEALIKIACNVGRYKTDIENLTEKFMEDQKTIIDGIE